MRGRASSVCVLLLACTGCMVGPNYKRPAATTPPAFKEQPPVNFKEAEAAGWKQSQPGDAYLKGKWWEIYNDAALNALEEQVSINNQNVLQSEAQYQQAKAEVRVARSALFPTAGTSPSVSVSRSGGGNLAVGSPGSTPVATGTSSGSAGSSTREFYSLPFDVSWEPDLWGSLRRGITASVASASSVAATLENVRLLYQAQLAEDYFQMHANDSQIDLLNRTVASYEEYLRLTKAQFNSGVASDLDVAEAETQLYGAQAQLIDVGVQRAQFEHAIAILIGKPPSELTIPAAMLTTLPPPVPVGTPSELLQRRPDIAAAERTVAAANEQIGIALAAFYPSLTLSGSGGFESSVLGQLLSAPARFWSVGPQLAETLFDAGRRRAVVAEDRAAYDSTVAAYRQTVLTALQQVEDNLAALRILEQESGKVNETVAASNRELNIATAEYKAGTVSYLNVLTAQATLLSAQETVITLLSRRLVASVTLVQALGGGWDTSRLPDPRH